MGETAVFASRGFLVFSLILIIGCKKYDQGPLISMHSKKGRVVGQWEFEINRYEQAN